VVVLMGRFYLDLLGSIETKEFCCLIGSGKACSMIWYFFVPRLGAGRVFGTSRKLPPSNGSHPIPYGFQNFGGREAHCFANFLSRGLNSTSKLGIVGAFGFSAQPPALPLIDAEILALAVNETLELNARPRQLRLVLLEDALANFGFFEKHTLRPLPSSAESGRH
jgi:hypothetical protein